MVQSQRLELRQGQSLVMTPQLQQSLKLLQFSSLELAEFIEDQIEQNPLLSKEDEKDKNETPSEEQGEEEKEAQPQAEERVTELSNEEPKEWEASGPEPERDFPSRDYERKSKNNSESYDFNEINAEREITLREHLTGQIMLDIPEPQERIISLHLLELLEDSGYLKCDLSEIAELFSCDVAVIETVVKKLQSMDPAGVFARNLPECLELQLRDKNRFDPAMEALVHNLELLANGDFPRLLKLCNVEKEDLMEMCSEIKRLNPKPAHLFSTEPLGVIQPDIQLYRTREGGWKLELNSEVLPRVLVDRTYHSEIVGKLRTPEEKRTLSEYMQSANWLVKTLNQRAETLLKVATEIVSQQSEFFEKGIYYLKPLVLRDIADKLGLHESTVGRVTTQKYMNTPKGVYELKYFFSSGVGGGDNEDFSSKTIKHFIKQWVDEEAPEAVLSDDTISERLKNKGMNVARRTVTKYREALNIGSSIERKRQKKAMKLYS